jgi:peptide/nickel transport system ATP-binding protein
LQDIGFELRVGETLGVVGESGSGKSTLLHLLLGLRTPYQGTALLAPNHDLTAPLARRSLALLRDIQMAFQNPGGTLNPRHTVEEILARPLRLYAGELALGAVQRRAIELLEQVRLGIHHLGRYPTQLSGANGSGSPLPGPSPRSRG